MILRPAVVLGGAVVLASAMGARPAHATLEEDAARVERSWAHEGLQVSRKPAAFLEQTRMHRVPISEDDVSGDGCTTIAVIGPRGADFLVRARPLERGVGPAVVRSERSSAGIAFVARCGEDRRDLGGVIVELRSARAAIEVIVAHGSATASTPTQSALVERFVPPARPPIDPGRAPGQDAIGRRAARVETRARGDGATAVATQVALAGEEGQGRVFLALREGCHRLELLSELGARGRIADLDAELRDAATNAILSRDRSDTPDARLDVCVGEPLPALLTFAGAPPAAKIAVLDARWPLPKGVPSFWGPRARGAIAMGLLRRRVPELTSGPVAEAVGVSGSTLVSVELEPGSCYVASAASMRGEARQMTLTAEVEGRAFRDDGAHLRDGATIAFCSRVSEHTTLRVEARGASLSWVLAMWNVGPATTEDGDS